MFNISLLLTIAIGSFDVLELFFNNSKNINWLDLKFSSFRFIDNRLFCEKFVLMLLSRHRLSYHFCTKDLTFCSFLRNYLTIIWKIIRRCSCSTIINTLHDLPLVDTSIWLIFSFIYETSLGPKQFFFNREVMQKISFPDKWKGRQ